MVFNVGPGPDGRRGFGPGQVPPTRAFGGWSCPPWYWSLAHLLETNAEVPRDVAVVEVDGVDWPGLGS